MYHKYKIDIESTLNSGQYFLWELKNGSWYGIYGDTILKITQKKENNGKKIIYEYDSFPEEEKDWQRVVFRYDDDYEKIIKEIKSKDNVIHDAIIKHQGLHIMRQKPIQCTLSFICSSNNNIPRIRLILRNLSKKFGKKIIWKDMEFYTFPSLNELHKASSLDLQSCGLGYRTKFVLNAVRDISDKKIRLDNLKEKSYEDAKKEILKLDGVGDKIADCILLFSCEKLEAFPIDTWIIKSLSQKLLQIVQPDITIKSKITPNQYKILSKKFREHYGEYSGYAQQFLYYNIRKENGRKW